MDQNGVWYWNYFHEPLAPSIKELRENDLLHACYTADGLLIYKKYGGKISKEINEDKILGGLKNFVQNKKVLRMFSRPELSPLSWDLGYFLYIISTYYPQEREMKSFIYQQILSRQEKDGFRFTERKDSSAIFVRYNAHILLGLSKYFWDLDIKK